MTKCVWRAPAQQRLLRFNCQTAVQKRPYYLRRRVRLRPLSLAKQSEGSGAPGGAACNIVRALLAKSAAPTGAPPETFASGLFAAFSFGGGPRFLTEVFEGLGVSQLLAGDHLVS